MADEPGGRTPGFEIRGRFYQFPTIFRVCDPVLVREVTGLEFRDFSRGLDEADITPDDDMLDPVVLAGLIAVGIWQKFPTWRREQVVQYVEQLADTDVKLLGLEPDGPAEAAADSPLQSGTDSSPSSTGSSSTPDPSDASTPAATGQEE